MTDILAFQGSGPKKGKSFSKDPLGSWDDPYPRTGGKTTGFSRCYVTHPALTVDGFKVYGGSCHSPVVTDADVYIGLDRGMMMTSQHYPWTPGYELLFHVPDMGVPASVSDFKALVDWMEARVREGLKVHAGCIGGHGRTGMLLSALVRQMMGETDAITYVREHYCKKAVESAAQVAWLHEHFGIKKVEGTKERYFGGAGRYPTSSTKAASTSNYGQWLDGYRGKGNSKPKTKLSTMPVTPVKSDRRIW